jgi:hypothetical protein
MVGVDDFVFNLADGQGAVLTYEAILVDTQTKASGTRKDDYTLKPERSTRDSARLAAAICGGRAPRNSKTVGAFRKWQ